MKFLSVFFYFNQLFNYAISFNIAMSTLSLYSNAKCCCLCMKKLFIEVGIR